MPPARIALWVASIGGIALLARSVLDEPVPLWVAVLALVGYLALAIVGAMVPQLEMYGDVFWRGDPGARRIALTFDDGPNPETTRRVLAILERYEAKATFFVIGRKARLHPDVIREIHDAGHSLGVHGYAHDRLFAFKPPKYVQQDIERTRRAVEEACGVRPTLFRPPIGHVSARTVAGARRADADLVAWSVRALDGLGGDPDQVAARIENGLRPGAVVALHDAAENDDREPASIEALPRVLRDAHERNLELVTVPELMAGPAPGWGEPVEPAEQ